MASYQGGVTAAVAVTAAVFARLSGAGGQFVDCSLQEAQLAIGYLPGAAVGGRGVRRDPFLPVLPHRRRDAGAGRLCRAADPGTEAVGEFGPVHRVAGVDFRRDVPRPGNPRRNGQRELACLDRQPRQRMAVPRGPAGGSAFRPPTTPPERCSKARSNATASTSSRWTTQRRAATTTLVCPGECRRRRRSWGGPLFWGNTTRRCCGLWVTRRKTSWPWPVPG